LASALEALLFVSGDPVTAAELARVLQVDEVNVEFALSHLGDRYLEGNGLRLQNVAGGWQLTTAPQFAEFVGRLLTRTASRLSRAAMETLAIVAYRQPVTSPEIEAVRGVAASGVLKTLLERGLITEAGKKMVPGRPMQYITTPDFLRYFGLPPLDVQDGQQLVVSADEVVDGLPHSDVSHAAIEGQTP
jgi:segregation and condensation protein B